MVDHRPNANAFAVEFGRARRLRNCVNDGGEQFGRRRSGYLRRGRRSGRRADDQISLGHIQPGVEQTGDDADEPRIARRSAATKDQRSLAREG